jgi:Excalibur calcium-binding domain
LAGAASERIPARWKNCTVVNKRYPRGVGRVGARDRTAGEPVTNFTHSNYLYTTAMRYNRGLDRDKDGIACEKQWSPAQRVRERGSQLARSRS